EFDLISFNIGIPLEKNRVPNTPTAAIATANSMYWEAWTEHIFFRFEGKFGPQKKAFLYHVTGDENLKTVIIDLKNNPLKVAVGARAKVVLKFHVDKVFSALDKIDVNISNNHMSGPVVARMANNYAKCFSLISVE
ncbi:MAG TPA: MbnP family protein, partial [Cytophagales bacterium]|nr:MbnP family protein [Cytophagales bacterium]